MINAVVAIFIIILRYCYDITVILRYYGHKNHLSHIRVMIFEIIVKRNIASLSNRVISGVSNKSIGQLVVLCVNTVYRVGSAKV